MTGKAYRRSVLFTLGVFTHGAWITAFQPFWELASEERNLATVNTAISQICSQSKPSPAPHETWQSDA